MAVKPEKLAQTILASVIDGSYPDSEEVAGAELTASALPEIVEYLRKARDGVYEDIRKVSRTNAEELDSWIIQAQRLDTDIAASQIKADEILELAKGEEALEQELEDAEMQARFLEGEIRFNDELTSILGRLQLIGTTLTQVESAMMSDLVQAIEVLGGADEALKNMGEGQTIVVGLMRERAAELGKMLKEKVEAGWGELVEIDKEQGSIRIRRNVERDSVTFSRESIVESLSLLKLLGGKVDQLHQQIDMFLVTPRLDTSSGSVPAFSVDEDTLRLSGRSSDLSVKHMFADLRIIFTFLNSNLPRSITAGLSRILVPSLTTRLRTTTLLQSVPASLDDLPLFEALLDETRKFEDYLQETHWTDEFELREWADRAPKVWLAKRKEACLDKVRKIVMHGINETKTVERSETQKVKKNDRKNSVVVAAAEDPWDDNWKDEDEAPPAVTTEVAKSLLQINVDDEEEEASGWGLDEDIDIDEEDPLKEQKSEESAEKVEGKVEGNPEEKIESKTEEKKSADDGVVEDEDLDWGEWGDDIEEPSKPQTPVTADFTPSTSASEANSSSPNTKSPRSKHMPHNSSSKDVTLRETYTITSIPDAVLEIIEQVISEASRLSTLPPCSITSAGPGLLTLPTLILAAYRALAPIYYAVDAASNMFLYNDCVRLSEELQHMNTPKGLTFSTAENSDVTLISSFGKRTYAKEMASQRTILTDYVESAQGFVRCTEYPQSLECETAINNIITRLCEVHASWSSVLSRSALSQAIGSLLNTVVTRLIEDIEDMSDIPEAESVKLAGFCEELAKLESLFPEGPSGMSTAGLYCHLWIKFRFLQQILESTMADIRYMFREGHLEGFQEEELVDLVQALFADSDNRRKLLDEIRRGRM